MQAANRSPTVYTIGFTKKTAEEFFGLLRAHAIRRLIDIRLHNTSQLAGFARRPDLEFFACEICNAQYVHEPLLAPSPELFQSYKKNGGAWDEFEKGFLKLMAERSIEKKFSPEWLEVRSVLVCSESTAERCHRRLVVQYLASKWGGLQAVHL